MQTTDSFRTKGRSIVTGQRVAGFGTTMPQGTFRACCFAMICGLLLAALISGCGNGSATQDQHDRDNASAEKQTQTPHPPAIDTPTEPEPDADGAIARDPSFDWDAVEPLDIIRATRVLLNLLRHLDLWYEGDRETIVITWSERLHATDGEGRRFVTTAEEWKGMLRVIEERSEQSRDGIARFRAMAADLYEDDFGLLTRHNYRVFIEAENRMRFENEGPHGH
jgi:hypothetical protein